MAPTRWLAALLRRTADRIDPSGAPHYAGLTFTIEPGRVQVREDGRGARLWYLDDYHLAHEHADGGRN